MAVETGQSISDIANVLKGDIKQYSFFEVVNQIRSSNGNAKSILFNANPSLGFRNSDLDDIKFLENSDEHGLGPLKMLVNFIGLHGANSPLPTFYTEDVLGFHEDESASRQFLDLFNHRLVEILYQIWNKYQAFKEFDAAISSGAAFIEKLAGLENLPYEDRRLLSNLLTLFGARGISAENLQKALSILLKGKRVEIVPNQRHWVELEETNWCRLGQANARLSDGALLGKSIESCENAFTIRIWLDESLNYEETNRRISLWLKVFSVSYLEYQIEYYLAPDVVQPGVLGSQGTSLGNVSLGKNKDNNYIKYVV